MSKAVTFAKIVIRVGFFAWVCYLCLWLYYGFSRPTVAQPNEGRVYALDTHGHVAYLTSREVSNLHVLLQASGGLIAMAVAVAIVAKINERFKVGRQFRRQTPSQ
jgi:hypothetical protein